MQAPPAPPAPATVAQALAAAQRAGLERLEAQSLLGHVLQRQRAWLIAHDDHVLAPLHLDAYALLWRRRAEGEPMAYLLGQQEFYGLSLYVSPATLVPRPDTETLVEWALAVLPPNGAVADLGTGSGAIALALKHRRPDATVTATDRSAAALAVARGNGTTHGLAVEWLQGSWWQPVQGRRFDVVVSNPPYIAADDPHLPSLRHEPLEALSPGGDGLDALRALAAGAVDHLVPGGWLLLEHGFDQADAVAQRLTGPGWVNVAHRCDLAGHRRCTGAQIAY